MGSVLPIGVVAISLVIALRFAAVRCDRARIKRYVERRGGRILEVKWSPFGPEWFGDESNCIYAVRYLDSEWNEHEAHCQTSIWTRTVHIIQDRTIIFARQPAPEADRPESRLKAENERPSEASAAKTLSTH